MQEITQYICETCNESYTTKEEALRCEASHKLCICMRERIAGIHREVIGYGRVLHAYLDFMDKTIAVRYDHCCDQGKTYTKPIKYCPFCGSKLL